MSLMLPPPGIRLRPIAGRNFVKTWRRPGRTGRYGPRGPLTIQDVAHGPWPTGCSQQNAAHLSRNTLSVRRRREESPAVIIMTPNVGSQHGPGAGGRGARTRARSGGRAQKLFRPEFAKPHRRI